MSNVLYVLLGVAAGTLAGMFGIGGGLVIVPTLVYLFGFTQHQAQGTSMAFLVAPVGLLGALAYYQKGLVDLRAAIFIILGFFLATLLGAKLAISLPDPVLKRYFGIFLLLVSIKMIVGK